MLAQVNNIDVYKQANLKATQAPVGPPDVIAEFYNPTV